MNGLRLRQLTRTNMRRLWNGCRVVISIGGGVVSFGQFGVGSAGFGDMHIQDPAGNFCYVVQKFPPAYATSAVFCTLLCYTGLTCRKINAACIFENGKPFLHTRDFGSLRCSASTQQSLRLSLQENLSHERMTFDRIGLSF
jgi:hypothetical protein